METFVTRLRQQTFTGPVIVLLFGGFLLVTRDYLTASFEAFMPLATPIADKIAFVDKIQILVTFLGSALLFLGVALFFLLYLRHGFRSLKLGGVEISESAERSNYFLENQIAQLTGMLNQAEDKLTLAIERAKVATVQLSQEDRQDLVHVLRNSIEKELGGGLLSVIEEKYGASVVSSVKVAELRRRFQETSNRLRMEISALGRRGNLNLVIGSLTTITGLAILGYLVLTTKIDASQPMVILAYYIPRLSLVLFIEIFAYFFLRLYRASLSEIKYFQNELTNAEFKFSAFEGAMLQGDQDALRKIFDNLASTERNFVLNKGQTTIELEKDRFEHSTLREIVGTLSGNLSAGRWRRKERS